MRTLSAAKRRVSYPGKCAAEHSRRQPHHNHPSCNLAPAGYPLTG
jgi:hypothetical protein